MIDVMLTPERPSQSVSVHPGEALRVKLEDVSTTGFRWQVKAFDEAAIEVSDKGVSATAAPGASGLREFDIKALKPSTTTLCFILVRPWQQGAQPEREASLTIEAR